MGIAGSSALSASLSPFRSWVEILRTEKSKILKSLTKNKQLFESYKRLLTIPEKMTLIQQFFYPIKLIYE